jgi:hypothetical protein
MSGKGSAPRPIPDYEKYADAFDAIFGPKSVEQEPALDYRKCEKCGCFWQGNTVSKNHCICE